MDARAASPTHARRHTVAGAELRRVLAAASNGRSTHPPIPPYFSAPGSSSTSPGTSPPTSSPSSAAGSPLVTPAAAPCAALPRAFDVRAAADVCRRIEGYVSFMDVEGLGAPPGVDDDDDACAARPPRERGWSWGAAAWLGLVPAPPVSATTPASPTSPTSAARRLPPAVDYPARSAPVAVRVPAKAA